jgi:hypothetical protein
MVSDAVTAALEKAAKRAARAANVDAGLEQGDPPKHPTQKKTEALEKAKTASRQVSYPSSLVPQGSAEFWLSFLGFMRCPSKSIIRIYPII